MKGKPVNDKHGIQDGGGLGRRRPETGAGHCPWSSSLWDRGFPSFNCIIKNTFKKRASHEPVIKDCHEPRIMFNPVLCSRRRKASCSIH